MGNFFEWFHSSNRTEKLFTASQDRPGESDRDLTPSMPVRAGPDAALVFRCAGTDDRVRWSQDPEIISHKNSETCWRPHSQKELTSGSEKMFIALVRYLLASSGFFLNIRVIFLCGIK
jgi:hypothetical protein